MSSPVATDDISRLLNEDYFLQKVLEALVDDGVHIYRLVCRRWNGICHQLPLKIKSNSMENLSLLAERYTRIVTLTLSCQSTVVDSFSLASLSHLGHLRLLLPPQDLQFPETVQRSLPSMSALRSLSLLIGSRDMLHSFIPTLRCMTQLTSLEVELCNDADIVDADPISELQRIKELKLSISLLINKSGELLFPKVLHLTKLEAYTHACSHEHIRIPLIEVRAECGGAAV